jgi:hypothetical protein
LGDVAAVTSAVAKCALAVVPAVLVIAACV